MRLELNMSKRILILGDSHISFFEHIYHGGYHHGHGYGFKPPHRTTKFDHTKSYDNLDIQVCKIQGATAYGITNSESDTGSNIAFSNFLENKTVDNKDKPEFKYYADIEANPPDFVCFFLGEVDCRALSYSLKEKYSDWKDILKKSSENLYNFSQDKVANKVVDPDRIIFLCPNLSKSIDPRFNSQISLEELTERTFFLQKELMQLNSIKIIDIYEDIFDTKLNTVKKEFLQGSDPIHLHGINVYNNKISTLWANKLSDLPDCHPNELHKLNFHQGINLDGGTGRWAKSNEEGKHSSSWRKSIND